VRLVWQGAGAAQLDISLERRPEASPDWAVLATVTGDAAGRVNYEDRAVVPGARYAYRLRWREAGTEGTTAEARGQGPHAPAVALEGARPNPVVGPLGVAFTLPSAAPATLELLDVAGTQVQAREVGSPSPCECRQSAGSCSTQADPQCLSQIENETESGP